MAWTVRGRGVCSKWNKDHSSVVSLWGEGMKPGIGGGADWFGIGAGTREGGAFLIPMLSRKRLSRSLPWRPFA